MNEAAGPSTPHRRGRPGSADRSAERSPGDPGSAVHQGYGDINQAGRDLVVHLPLPAPLPPPRQLPPDIRYFTGRSADIARLDAVFSQNGGGGPGPVLVSAIAGTAGVGKTALAVHWAHRVRERFPDGQLYIDLRGHAGGLPVEPAEALRTFLTALNVPPAQVPTTLAERQALYRSKLDGSRVLVVLDNAATPKQVRALVPNSPSCLVLVTSRSDLAGLVALDGAQRVTLGLLPPDEAVALLRRIVGAERMDSEPDAAAALAGACACLPLALRIAAERVAARPHSSLADLLDELEADRLDTLGVHDDPAAAVRVIFSWSYQVLAPDQAHLFRFLGLHPGPDIGLQAAAVLVGTAPDRARRLLRGLAGVHLLEETGPDRYRFHDLLRDYAAERAETEEAEPDRAAAVHRLLTWYLHTADAADRILVPPRRHVLLDPPEASSRPLSFTTRRQALDWCEAERANLVAAVRSAAEEGLDALASQLPVAMVGYFYLRKPWGDWTATHEVGLAAARRSGDPHGEAWLLCNLADAYYDLGRPQEAQAHYRQSLAIAREIGDRWAEGFALHGIGAAGAALGRPEDALVNYRQALAIAREIGDRWAEGFALNNLAGVKHMLHRSEEALDDYEEALAIRRAVGDAWAAGTTLHGLGDVHQDLGRHDRAAELYRSALATRREVGDRHGEAESCYRLGDALHASGSPEAARASWQQALALFEALDDDTLAGVVAVRLRDRPDPPTTTDKGTPM